MAAALPSWLRPPTLRGPANLQHALQLSAPRDVVESNDGRFFCARASGEDTVECLLVIGNPWTMSGDNVRRRYKYVWRDGSMPGLIFGSDSDSAEAAFAEALDAELNLRRGAWTTFANLSHHDQEVSLVSAGVHARLDTASLKGIALDFSDAWGHLSDRGKAIMSTIWRVGPAEVRDVFYARFNGNGPLASYPAGISSGDSKVALLITWIYHLSRVLPLLFWVFSYPLIGGILAPVLATLSMAAHRWSVMKDVEHPTLWEQGACVLRDTISILMASPALAVLRKGDLKKTVLTGVAVLTTNSLTRRLRNDWVLISKPGRHARPPVDGNTDVRFRLGVGAVLEGWASRGITGWELGLSSEDVLVLKGYALTRGVYDLFAAISIKQTADTTTLDTAPSASEGTEDEHLEDETSSLLMSDVDGGASPPVSGSTNSSAGERHRLRRSSIVHGDGSFMGQKPGDFRRLIHHNSTHWQRDFPSPDRFPPAARTAPWSAHGPGLKKNSSGSSEGQQWDVEEVHLVQYGTDWKFIRDHGTDRMVGFNSLGELYGFGLEKTLMDLDRGDRDVVQTVNVNGGSFVTSLPTIDLLASRKPPIIATYEELVRISQHQDNGRHLLSLQPIRQKKFRFKVKGAIELHPFCRVRKANVLTSVRWFHSIPFSAYILVSSFFPSYFTRWVVCDVAVASAMCVCLEPRVGVPAWTRIALSMYQVQREGWHWRSLCMVCVGLLAVEVYVGTLRIGMGKSWLGPLFSLGFCPCLSEAAFCMWHVIITARTGETLDSVLAPAIG